MKQFQIVYRDDAALRGELANIKAWCAENPAYTKLFRVYSTDMELEHVAHVCEILEQEMPEALYLGSTSHANMLNGALEPGQIIMSCTVFEYESTRVRVLQLPFGEKEARSTVSQLKAACAENPWISTIEMHVTMLGISVREFCEEMSTLPSGIQVFGGGAYNPQMDETLTAVFSKGNGFSTSGIVFLLLGGSDLQVYSTYIAGWKPLTREFKVTRAKGATLYELDGQPAFHIYQKFLKISRSDNLIANTLEFPLFMNYKGVDVLRCPLGLNEDDSLMMATETPEGSTVRIAYGDPETILNNIRQDGQRIADFQPEVIQAFSCAARRAFWGDENVSDETVLLDGIAPISGFYTVGEFIRTDGAVRNFNITLVLAAMREGVPERRAKVNLYDSRMDKIENEERIPLIRRFVAFIEATTQELEDANKRLAVSSITDGLTKLYNRAEIERGIRTALRSQRSDDLSLIMLDIDNFKHINDVYGHQEGDNVIIALSNTLRGVMEDVPDAYIGRWGGEEFMVLLHNSDMNTAAALAEQIRTRFAARVYRQAQAQTVSIGVTQAHRGESADALCSRVDKALYAAKANGKNQVVTIE